MSCSRRGEGSFSSSSKLDVGCRRHSSSTPRKHRHSTPKKDGGNDTFDSTQYIPLPLQLNDKARHSSGEKDCHKYLVFKETRVGVNRCQVEDTIERLEVVRQCLDRENDILSKTQLALVKLSESNRNMERGLDRHLETMNNVHLQLGDVALLLTSLMAKEDCFLARLSDCHRCRGQD